MEDKAKLNTVNKGLPRHWALICIVNLLIACSIGLLMRYKIAYPLPGVDMDNLLHAHAHFVFCGWACLTLFCCMVGYLLPDYYNSQPVYRTMFYLLEASAFGLLISFLYQGFGTISISFSALFMVVFYWFIVKFWYDHSKCHVPTGIIWFTRMAFIWFVVSSIGLYYLSNISINGSSSGIATRATVYFYFHFTYNGFFTFSIFGILLNWLYKMGFYPPKKQMKIVFWLMTLGVAPGYLLSIIGFYPFDWIEILSIFAVVTHFAAAFILLLIIGKNYRHFGETMHNESIVLWKIATAAYFLKVVLQGASLVPELAKFAFSFRPLVIGYLHLAFLCFISFFLIGYMLGHGKLQSSTKLAKWGIRSFIVFVILNELVLFAHSGLVYFSIYLNYNYFSIALLWITIGMFLGLLLFVIAQKNLFEVANKDKLN